jgi:hypothetical protein
MMKFYNNLTGEERKLIDQGVMENLFEDWWVAQADEGDAYLEEELMRHAPDYLKRRFNEFYGYKWDEVI